MPIIHVAELQRVYPKLNLATGDAIGQMPDATGQLHAYDRVLQVRLEAKDREAEDLRQQLCEERERHDETKTKKARFLEMLEEAQKRIPALPAHTSEEQAILAPRTFWQRIFK